MNRNEYVELRSVTSTDRNEPNSDRRSRFRHRSEQLGRAINNFCKKLCCCSDAYLDNNDTAPSNVDCDTALQNIISPDKTIKRSKLCQDNVFPLRELNQQEKLDQLDHNLVRARNQLYLDKKKIFLAEGITDEDRYIAPYKRHDLLPLINTIKEEFYHRNRQLHLNAEREACEIMGSPFDGQQFNEEWPEQMPECDYVRPSPYTTPEGRKKYGEATCERVLKAFEERLRQDRESRAKTEARIKQLIAERKEW